MQNRARNRFQNRFPHRFGTRSGTTDQNQNQNQTVLKAGLVVVGGADQIQSGRHLGPRAAPIGFGDQR